MWYKIKKGVHRAFPLSLGIHKGKTSESYEVIFDESCRYVPDELNSWNKLDGWSYGILPTIKFKLSSFDLDGNMEWDNKFIPAHHINSIRIGWRYNPELDKIELALYLYKEGERIIIPISDVFLNKKYELKLDMFNSETPLLGIRSDREEKCGTKVIYDLAEITKIPKYKPTWGYNLGLFFGGQASTQHDTKVFIKKL